MTKKFSEIPEGGIVYVVYDSNYDLDNSLHQWKIAKGYVIENKEHEYKRVNTDPYEEDEEYTYAYVEKYIRFEVPEIEREGIFENKFGRRYSKFYDDKGTMICNVDSYTSDKNSHIWLDVFTEYKNAKEYLLQTCKERKEYLQKKISDMQNQLNEYNNIEEFYKDIDESCIN